MLNLQLGIRFGKDSKMRASQGVASGYSGSEQVMLNNDPKSLKLGSLHEVDVYTDSSGGYVAFLANIDDKNDATVQLKILKTSLDASSRNCKHGRKGFCDGDQKLLSL